MSRYKLNTGYSHYRIANETVLLPVGKSTMEEATAFTLNGLNALIVDQLLKGETPQSIAAKMAQAFDVPQQDALNNVLALVERMVSDGCLVEDDAHA